MQPPLLVTIGIPFLNARQTLPDALRSVFAQTYENWELLLVDDGSDDGSLDVVRQISDPRVRVIADGGHRGLVYRLNQIAALARGNLLARMDADDLMHPERIERQVRFLEENPACDAVDTATFTVDARLRPLGIRGDGPLATSAALVLKRGLFVHPTVMARIAWFRAHLYDPAFVRAEDHELWCRSFDASRFGRLHEPLFFYREDPAGNLANYLRSAETARLILRTYGPAIVGRWRTKVLLGQSYARSIIYRAYTSLGQQGRLIRRRNRPVTAAEDRAARETLAALQRILVPGLCETHACEEVCA